MTAEVEGVELELQGWIGPGGPDGLGGVLRFANAGSRHCFSIQKASFYLLRLLLLFTLFGNPIV